MRTNQVWLLKSLCWSSMVLVAPAAIAQEASTSTRSQPTAPATATTHVVTQFIDHSASIIVATPNSSDFTTTASDLTLVESTSTTSPDAQITVTPSMNRFKLQAEPLAASSTGSSENEPSYHFSNSDLIAALEPQSPSLLPAWTPDQTNFPANLSSLELAQVRPTAGGVSGPPIPSYPATSGAGTSSELPTSPESEATTPANKWHFLLQPYIYFPLSIYGDTTVKGFDTNFAFGASSIFSAFTNTFKFGVLGRIEGWTPDYHWGFLLDGNYLKFGKKHSFTRPNPNRFLDLAINRIADRIQAKVDSVLRQQVADYLRDKLDGRIRAELEARLRAKLNDIIPSKFESDIEIESWNVDLAGAYRIYNQSQVNPKGVATEFDLGPYLLDIALGIRIAGVSADLDVTTNLGGEGDFSRSVTTVKPLLGTRFRYNLSPRLAAVLAGTIAGFDIGTLGLNWEVFGGLDWMFSGNTSVGLGYRFSYMKYKSGSGSDAFEVSTSNNGPYMTFTFRF